MQSLQQVILVPDRLRQQSLASRPATLRLIMHRTVGLAAIVVVQRFGVGLVIERSLVRLSAGALSSQLGQLSLPSLRGR